MKYVKALMIANLVTQCLSWFYSNYSARQTLTFATWNRPINPRLVSLTSSKLRQKLPKPVNEALKTLLARHGEMIPTITPLVKLCLPRLFGGVKIAPLLLSLWDSETGFALAKTSLALCRACFVTTSSRTSRVSFDSRNCHFIFINVIIFDPFTRISHRINGAFLGHYAFQ